MAVTNVKELAGKIRAEIASVKQESQDAVNDIVRAVAIFRERADSVKRVAKEIREEADELGTAIAEVSNSGPPLDE